MLTFKHYKYCTVLRTNPIKNCKYSFCTILFCVLLDSTHQRSSRCSQTNFPLRPFRRSRCDWAGHRRCRPRIRAHTRRRWFARAMLTCRCRSECWKKWAQTRRCSSRRSLRVCDVKIARVFDLRLMCALRESSQSQTDVPSGWPMIQNDHSSVQQTLDSGSHKNEWTCLFDMQTRIDLALAWLLCRQWLIKWTTTFHNRSSAINYRSTSLEPPCSICSLIFFSFWCHSRALRSSS